MLTSNLVQREIIYHIAINLKFLTHNNECFYLCAEIKIHSLPLYSQVNAIIVEMRNTTCRIKKRKFITLGGYC